MTDRTTPDHPDLVDQIRDLGARLCMAAMADASAHVYRETGERHATGYHFNRPRDGIGPWRA